MKKTIYWHIEDSEKVPKDNYWLSADELKFLEKLKFLKRRTEWRLGRWTTKNALHEYFAPKKNIALQDLAILTKENGAPYVKINNKTSKIAISVSHREGKALCVFSKKLKAIGCDLEFIEQRSDIFINDYFTEDEIKIVKQYKDQKDRVANLIWSAKESVSKAVQLGLNLSTRDVNVHTIEFSENKEWNDLNMSLKNKTPFYGKWQQINNYTLTIASTEYIEALVRL